MSKTFDINAITPEKLQEYRSVTDEEADNVVAAIIGSGFEKQINDVFMTLVRNTAVSSQTFSAFDADLAKILTEYFETTAQLPTWADHSLIEKGEQVFIDYGPEIFMLLNVSSLPMCYTCAKGAQVLYDTGRLLSHNGNVDPLARRLMETAQMIVNVMSPGGLSAQGGGIITIQKIRLIHASIRHFLKQGQYKNTPWDANEFGEPINQEDLAGTLMSFAPVVISGLKQLKVKLNDEDIQGYCHTWKVVGHLMGIKEDLLPDTYQQGFDLAVKILAHQADSSEAGCALTASCVEFMNHMLPGTAFDDVPSYMIDFFLKDFASGSGKDLSTFIGIDPMSSHKDKIMMALARFVIGGMSNIEHDALIRKVTPYFNRLLMQGIIHHYNHGKSVHFSIPPSLQKNWGLTEEWQDHKVVSPNLFGNRLMWQKQQERLN